MSLIQIQSIFKCLRFKLLFFYNSILCKRVILFRMSFILFYCIITVNIQILEPEVKTSWWTRHFLVPRFKWFGFEMVNFIAIKWYKPDRKSNGHLIFGLAFRLLQDCGQKYLVLGWPVPAEVDHLKPDLSSFMMFFYFNEITYLWRLWQAFLQLYSWQKWF